MTDDAVSGIYVVFDGPPGHESGRFVEVETERGKGLGMSNRKWERVGHFWRLGPFADTEEIASLRVQFHEALQREADLRKEVERLSATIDGAFM